MEYVMNLLAGLGDHFVLIAVGCIEAAVAAVFVGMQLGKNAKSLRKKLALEGANVVGGCLYFYNPSLSQSTWFDANRVYYTTIGGHAFYL